MPVDTPDTRGGVLVAVLALDAEAFTFVVAQLWQFAQTAGGFGDKAGWKRVRLACEAFMPEVKDPADG
jgi:hypothetical protein